MLCSDDSAALDWSEAASHGLRRLPPLGALLQRGLNFGVLREAAGFLLGKNLGPVHEDFEASVAEGLQLQEGDALLELFQNFLRQTDGIGFVASSGAVFNGDLHRSANRGGIWGKESAADLRVWGPPGSLWWLR